MDGPIPSLRSLEAQMAVPMFNEHPIEMGMNGREREIAARLHDAPAIARAVRPRRFPAIRIRVSHRATS